MLLILNFVLAVGPFLPCLVDFWEIRRKIILNVEFLLSDGVYLRFLVLGVVSKMILRGVFQGLVNN